MWLTLFGIVVVLTSHKAVVNFRRAEPIDDCKSPRNECDVDMAGQADHYHEQYHREIPSPQPDLQTLFYALLGSFPDYGNNLNKMEQNRD